MDFCLLLFFCCLTAHRAFVEGRRSKRLLRLVSATETTPIAKVCPGFFETTGAIVEPRSPLASPTAKKPCVYWRLVIEVFGDRGRARSWETLVDVTKKQVFTIADGEASIKVDVGLATMELVDDAPWAKATWHSLPPAVRRQLVHRPDFDEDYLEENPSLRYRETLLEPGDELYVLGEVDEVRGTLRFVGGEEPYLVADMRERALVGLLEAQRSSHRWSLVLSLLFVLTSIGTGVALLLRH